MANCDNQLRIVSQSKVILLLKSVIVLSIFFMLDVEMVVPSNSRKDGTIRSLQYDSFIS